MAAIEQALEARRDRIRLSQLQIAPIQWAVIIALTVLILVTIAMIHIDNRTAMAATMFIFSTAVALCFVLLMAFDRPFAFGGVDHGTDNVSRSRGGLTSLGGGDAVSE